MISVLLALTYLLTSVCGSWLQWEWRLWPRSFVPHQRLYNSESSCYDNND